MSFHLRASDQYSKNIVKFLKTHPDLVELYKKTIRLLAENPQHPSLRLHKLSGKLKDYSSISINLKYRITIDFVIENEVIILIGISNHYS